MEQSLVAGLFGPAVRVVVSPLTARLDALPPDERCAVAGAVPLRQRQFATGRACARALLAAFGLPAAALPPGRDRAPRWPRGFVGSIAHAGGLCVAAVARRAEVAGLGIDLEEDEGLGPELWDLICTPGELAWLTRQPPACRGRRARALFSAKECTYKSLSAQLRSGFEPRRFDVRLDLAGGSFAAGVVGGSGPLAPRCRGSIRARGGWIVAGMALAQHAAAGGDRR